MARYDDTDVERMAAEGRKPSYDPRGNVRGFRSKPGAPMADTSSNIPMSGPPKAIEAPSLTPKGIWSKMFTPQLGNARTGQPAGSSPSNSVNSALKEIFNVDPSMSGPSSPVASTATPSLDILAQGGPTHAQQWGAPALAPKNGLNFNDVQVPGGVQRSAKNKYGWGSSFLPT
jgi:hypothetical protein